MISYDFDVIVFDTEEMDVTCHNLFLETSCCECVSLSNGELPIFPMDFLQMAKFRWL